MGRSPNARFKLYENTGCQGNWLQVAVEGNGEQTPIGARVSVTVDGETRVQALNSKSDFHSQDTRVLHFGLGQSESVDRVATI